MKTPFPTLSLDDFRKDIDMSGRLSGSVSSALTANLNIFEAILKDVFSIPYKKRIIKNNVYVRLSNIFVDLNATNKLY